MQADPELIRVGFMAAAGCSEDEINTILGESVPAAIPEQDLSNIEVLLLSPSIQHYLGRATGMKLEMLAIAIKGRGNVSAIARRYKVSKQAAQQMAHKAREAVCQAAD